MNTTVYGVHYFKGEDPLVKAVRHVIKPALTFNFTPEQQNHSNGRRTVQADEYGNMRKYNIYNGQKFPALGGSKSASMGIAIGNSLEFKLRNRKDTNAETAEEDQHERTSTHHLVTL